VPGRNIARSTESLNERVSRLLMDEAAVLPMAVMKAASISRSLKARLGAPASYSRPSAGQTWAKGCGTHGAMGRTDRPS
jgi:hypothetical protein